MRRILDYDAFTGTTTWHEYKEETDTTVITEIQDVEPFLKVSKELRKEDEITRKGIKNGMWSYATLPNSIINKMLLEDGVNVFAKGMEKEVIRLINTKYPQFKNTRGRHA